MSDETNIYNRGYDDGFNAGYRRALQNLVDLYPKDIKDVEDQSSIDIPATGEVKATSDDTLYIDNADLTKADQAGLKGEYDFQKEG